MDLATPKKHSSSNYRPPTASVASAKEPASLAPSANGLAIRPAFYVPREVFSHHDDSYLILYLKFSPQRILEVLFFGTHSFVPNTQVLQASLETLATY